MSEDNPYDLGNEFWRSAMPPHGRAKQSGGKMNTPTWDAKKAELQAERARYLSDTVKAQSAIASIDADLAALGPRPAERRVEWEDSDVKWTWTHDGKEFHRACNHRGNDMWSNIVTSVLVDRMPPAKVIEVAALALPEGPVLFMNEYESGNYTTWRTEEGARNHHAAIHKAIPLYRTPQPPGVEVGRIDPHGTVAFNAGWYTNHGIRNHKLIAVPTTEAK